MSQNLVSQLKEKILQFQPDVKVEKVGTVLEVGDGVARVSGLTQAASMEMLDFSVSDNPSLNPSPQKGRENVMGVALNLEENMIGSVILGDYHGIKVGDTVSRIAGKFSVSIAQVLGWNQLRADHVLMPGQRLVLLVGNRGRGGI